MHIGTLTYFGDRMRTAAASLFPSAPFVCPLLGMPAAAVTFRERPEAKSSSSCRSSAALSVEVTLAAPAGKRREEGETPFW